MRLTLCSLALVAFGANAAPSYDYIELAAIGVSYSEPTAALEDDATGVRLTTSMAIDDEWFWTFQAAGTKYQSDYGNAWRFGVGYAFPLDLVDVVVELQYGRNDFGPASGGGFAYDLSVHSVQWDTIEVFGHIGQTQIEPIDGLVRYGIGAALNFSDSFALTAEYDISDGSLVDLTGYAVGIRWNY